MSLTYQELIVPNYLNNKSLYANLTVTDGAIAAVLAKLNLMLVGDTGSGKTQLANDIYNFLFGGNIAEKGRGIKIRAHAEVDIYNEIFSQINIKEGKRELTDNIDALIYFVDELNRAPSVSQGQFFGLGDGMMDFQGRGFHLGRDGYHFLITTANIGNEEFNATFDTDKALYNRLHVTLDFDHEDYKPTEEDFLKIRDRKADPSVKEAPLRDISDKIIVASKEIGEMTRDPGIEALAVMHYLTFGLNHCLKYQKKGKVWPMGCHDCEHNQDTKGKHALCSLVKTPAERTLQSVLRYSCALQYLAQLKNKKQPLDAVDLVFKAFELTGAYQQLLNPTVLKTEHFDHNPSLMKEVVKELKKDFRANENYIISGMEKAQNGKKVTEFFEQDGVLCAWDALGKDGKPLSDQARKKLKKIDPFKDEGKHVGLSWVKTVIDYELAKLKEAQSKKKRHNPEITEEDKEEAKAEAQK